MLGRPRIDRLVVRILIDANSVLATVLAGGQLRYTNSFTLRVEHLLVLKNEWEPAGKGTAAAVPGTAPPGYPLYFSIAVRTRVASLRSPDDEAQTSGFGQVSRGTTAYWNVHEWTLN